MINSKIVKNLERFSDDQLRDILRENNLQCSGRRHLIINRLASAIKQGKISGIKIFGTMGSRSTSPGSEDNATANVKLNLPPVPRSEESDFYLPDDFAPLHLQSEVANILDPNLGNFSPVKLRDKNSNGAIPKYSAQSQVTSGYFPSLPLPTDQHIQSQKQKSVKMANTDMFPRQNVTAGNPQFNFNNLNSRTLQNQNNVQPNSFARPHVNANRNQDNSFTKAIEAMRRWNLKFSGSKLDDPENFLTRLNEGRAIVPITNQEFLRCLPFFLEGVALHWFRNERDNWQSLNDFTQAFRSRFGPIDYQNALFFEIRNRTQGSHESVSDFLTCMKSLMARSVPAIPPGQQIEIISRNLLPSIQNGIDTSNINDLNALERSARYRERRLAVSKEYKPPPPAFQALHADFAYQEPRTQVNHNNPRFRNLVHREPVRLANLELPDDPNLKSPDYYVDEFDELPYLTQLDDNELEELAHLRLDSKKPYPRIRTPARPNSNSALAAVYPDSKFCYRCGDPDGHTIANCTGPKRIFCRGCRKLGRTRNNCEICPPVVERAYCWGCGLMEVTRKNCPKCSKPENS